MRVTLSMLALGALMMQATPVLAQATAPSSGGGGLAGSTPITPAPSGPVSSPNALPSTPPGSAAATQPATPGASTAARKSGRQTLDARFAAANATHDGHLTLEQAQAANWNYVAKNFTAMDKSSRGYVTVADVRGYSKARRAARKHTPAAPAAAVNPQPLSPQ